MKPALTAEEWKQVAAEERGEYSAAPMIYGHFIAVKEAPLPQLKRLHALAALCLHGQPYGFSREDVKALRDVTLIRDGGTQDLVEHRLTLESLAARIEALLPPEAPNGGK